MLRTALFPLLLLALAGCASLPGPTGQLDRMTRAQAEGRDAANAAEVAEGDCLTQPGEPACLRIQAIRGRACLAMARAEAAPGAACPPPTASVRKQLDCAVDAYAKARGAAPAGSVDAINLAENSARAQYCASGLRAPAEGLALLRQARTELAALPATPERDLLSASAALALAQRTALPPAERCSGAREAARLAVRAMAPEAAQATRDAARATQNAARQEAAGLAGCGGV